MTQTIAAGMGTLVTGPAGCSKRDTIRTLAVTVGRNLAMFDCSPFSPISSLANAVLGSAIGGPHGSPVLLEPLVLTPGVGSWLALINPSRLSPVVASALAATLTPILAAVRARKENEYKFEEVLLSF